MTQIMKRAIVLGAGLSSLVTTAAADTFDDVAASDKQTDDIRMNTWRDEVREVETDNAKNEADYRKKVAEAQGKPVNVQTLDEIQNENAKRKAAYEKEKREVDERNRQKRAKYHDDYRHYLDYKTRGAKEPTVPTYEPLPKLELLPETISADSGAGFEITRPIERQIPHVPKLDFIGIPNEMNEPLKNPYNSTSTRPVEKPTVKPVETPKPVTKPTVKSVETPKPATKLVTQPSGIEYELKTNNPGVGELALEEGEVEKTSSEATVDKNSEELLTVKWIDEAGKAIKDAITGNPKNAPEHGDIKGYDYITSKRDQNELVYMFKKKAEQAISKIEAPKPEPTSPAQPTLSESNTAVYVTSDSKPKSEYYYTEAVAQKHNSKHTDITRTTEQNAKNQGFKWVGEKEEPNPQKTPFETKSQGSARPDKLPYTGDANMTLIGSGLSAIGALSFKRKQKKAV